MTDDFIPFQTGGSAIPVVHFASGAAGSAYVVGGTATVGMASDVTMVSIVPETHPHDQAHRQPLEAIECLSMIVPMGILVAQQARRLLPGAHE